MIYVQVFNFFLSNTEEAIRIADSKNFQDLPHSLHCVSSYDMRASIEGHRAGSHNGKVREVRIVCFAF